LTGPPLGLASVCALIPDIDVLAFRFGIAYQSPFGHRGFTHSILFAAVLGLVLVWIYDRNRTVATRLRIALFYFIVALSHGILDALTDGGLGVGFFIPFSSHRYFLPWHPIKVSPIGLQSFLSFHGLQILQNEAIWIGIPCVVLLVVHRYFYRSKILGQI
jgi:inner membrane protein